MPVLISDMTRKIFHLVLLLYLIMGLGVVVGQQSKDPAANSPAQAKPSAEGPIVEYQQPQPEPPVLGTEDQNKRRIKDRRYDGYRGRPIDDSPDVPIPSTGHWWQGLPALPVTKSDVVLLGTVTTSRALFSSDRTTVYSEFIIQVEEVFKNQSSRGIGRGSSVVTDRFGGVVRFPDGRTKVYRWRREGWPLTSRRYLLFLKNNEAGDFDIITGYELRDGATVPLDGADGRGGISAPFNTYAGASESALRAALANALQEPKGASR